MIYEQMQQKYWKFTRGIIHLYVYIITLPLINNEKLLKYIKEKYFLLLHICNTSFPRFRRIYILCDGLLRQILWDAKIYKRCKFGKLPESCKKILCRYLLYAFQPVKETIWRNLFFSNLFFQSLVCRIFI